MAPQVGPFTPGYSGQNTKAGHFLEPALSEATLIYTCQLSREEKFTFYVTRDERLIVAHTKDGETKQLTLGKKSFGLENFKENLNKEKINELRKFLDNVRFRKTAFGELEVQARVKGGWGEAQHKGYGESSSSPIDGVKSLISFFENLRSPSEEDELKEKLIGGGSYTWMTDIVKLLTPNQSGLEVGNDGLNPAAKALADGCQGVDEGETSPELHFTPEAQSWHFNISDCQGGTVNDSRFAHAVENLLKAVSMGEDESLANMYELGRGLHPLQDVFAHTDTFVRRFVSDNEGSFMGHIWDTIEKSDLADSVTYMDDEFCSFPTKIKEKHEGFSQRYSDAKTVTYIYTYLHNIFKDGDESKQVQDMIEARLKASLKDAPNLQQRGTHGIGGFLLALKNELAKPKYGLDKCTEENAAIILNKAKVTIAINKFLEYFRNAKLIATDKDKKEVDVVTEIPRMNSVDLDDVNRGEIIDMWYKMRTKQREVVAAISKIMEQTPQDAIATATESKTSSRKCCTIM